MKFFISAALRVSVKTLSFIILVGYSLATPVSAMQTSLSPIELAVRLTSLKSELVRLESMLRYQTTDQTLTVTATVELTATDSITQKRIVAIEKKLKRTNDRINTLNSELIQVRAQLKAIKDSQDEVVVPPHVVYP